jgi:Ca-activated chloride channel family protein
MTIDLQLFASVDRTLARARGGSMRYLVATLEATRTGPQAGPAPRAPMNLALVIDASGSMTGAPLAAAKRAAIGVLDRLGPDDRLTVVSFASDVVVHADCVSADDAAREDARRRIEDLETRGCTNLSAGWFEGVECAARAAESNAALCPRAVILSDGHANEGIVSLRELARHAEQLRVRGVVTSALGIGDGYDDALLAELADNGGGRLHDAETADEIERVLLGEIGEAAANVVERAQLDLSLPAGVTPTVLGRAGVASGPGWSRIQIGGLAEGTPRSVVVQLKCPRGEPGDELVARLSASGAAAATGEIVESPERTATLTLARGAQNSAQSRDPDVARTVARAWHAHVLRHCAMLNKEGAFDKAGRFAQRQLKHFERYVSDLPGTDGMVDELRLLAASADTMWSSRTRKEAMMSASMELREGSVDHRGAARKSWSRRLCDGE